MTSSADKTRSRFGNCRLLVCHAALALTMAFTTSHALAFQGDGQLFNDLNMAGRSAYAKEHSKMLPADFPIFLVTGKVSLIKGSKSGERSYTPPLYDQLKSLSHLSLGIAAAGLFALETPNDQSWRSSLLDLRSKAISAKARLDSSVLNTSQKQRQIAIIDQSLAFMDDALAKSSINSAALKQYTQAMSPLLLANTTEAARAQIEMLDRAVNDLGKDLSPEEWNRALVVLTGPKTAREGNLQSQYFMFRLGEKIMGQRIIYVENIFDEDQALSVLQTVLTDRKIGALFFNDPSRMERDLLSDAATAELMQRFGRLGHQKPLP